MRQLVAKIINKIQKRPFKGYAPGCEPCLLCQSAKRNGACLRGLNMGYELCGIAK